MKKNIRVFLICMVAVLALTALTACNPEETPTNPTECAHQGGEANCLEPAVCAVCGEFYGEAKGHSFGQWTVKTEAGCEVAGEETRTCSCGTVETREIAATGHSYGQWTVKTEATCDAAGEETCTCSCGATETRELAATGHSFGQWSVRTTAGCETAGQEVRACGCGKEEQRDIPALGHAYAISYTWSDDQLACTASAICGNDESHTLSETVTIRTVKLNVTAEKVTYVYEAAFANGALQTQTRSVDGTVTLDNGLVTVTAPAISGLVPSHDYVKFSFRGGETAHSFTVYYSELDVWDGKTVSTSLSGAGTQSNPYLIQSGADLAYLKRLVDAAGSYKDSPCAGQYFKLTKSIDLGGANFMIGSCSAWNKNQAFAGVLDGNNCSIRGLKIETAGDASAALFGCVKDGGVVKNLSLYGSVKSEKSAGAAVAYLTGTLQNVTNYANVTGVSTVGGIAGNAGAKNKVSSGLVNYGSVTSTSYLTGGVVGSLSYSLSDATNWGTVTSAGNVNTGGITGACHKDRPGTLTNCANYGTIDNNGKPAGHIAGLKNSHTYVNCVEIHDLTKVEAKEATCAGDGNIEYYYCSVCQGNLDAEGNALTVEVVIPATGHSFGEQTVTVSPTCEATGWATCECSCGTVQMVVIPAWGHSYGEATYTWSEDGSTCTAIVTCPNGMPHIIEENATIVISMEVFADKVICSYRAEFENDYFATQTGKTEELTAAVVNGMMTVTAPKITGLVPSHDYVMFHFHSEEATYTFDIYYSEVDVWDGTSVSESLSGSGTAADPYLVQSGADLAYIADTVNALTAGNSAFGGKYFKMTKSIDLNGHVLHIGTGNGWSTRQCFAGIFDGNNCSIRGINNTLSLFATVYTGEIRNLSVYGKVNTTVNTTGAVVGYLLNSTMHNVTNYADVTGVNAIGGLVGVMEQKGKTSEGLVNYGSVTGKSWQTGGIAGKIGGNLKNAANWGTVTATSGNINVGGIAGSSQDKAGWEGTLTNCVSYGAIDNNGVAAGHIIGVANRIVLVDCPEWHVLEHVDEIPADCGVPGNVAYDHCTVCLKNFDAKGNVLESVETDALAHNYEAVVTPPTCTEDGYTTHTCSLCGDSYTDSPVPAPGHTEGEPVREKEVAATCTKEGSYDSVVYCSVCTTELSREAKTIEKQPHKDENGDSRCDDCTGSICTEHTEVIDEAVEATCTETGLTEGSHCSVCGDVIKAQETVPVKGHSYVKTYVWSDDNSTCTASEICQHDASHVQNEETATVSTVGLSVSATKVTYTYHVAFANSIYTARTKTIEADVTLANKIATINAPAIANRVASHDYVKFGFHDAEATYTFTIYYSELSAAWDGTTASTGLSGSGTETDPYLIQSGADLAYVAKVVNDAAANTANFKGAYFKMTKSIDLNGNELKIGGYSASKVFHGYFDGNNCSIRGLNNTQSLFGMLKDGYIKNLSTYGTVTTTEKKGVAGLVSYMSGATVENITNYVNVTGVQQVAGVVGWLENNTTSIAKNCVNYGKVTGTSYQVGGIAGFAKGTLTGCTNFGDVTSTASGYVGGIGGAAKDAKGSRSDCVNYGNISGTDYVGGCFGLINKTTTDCYSYGTATGTTANVGEVVGGGASYLVYTNTAG